jgi:flagellar biogenesis protein FliO
LAWGLAFTALSFTNLTFASPAFAQAAPPAVTEDGAVVFGAENNMQGVESRPAVDEQAQAPIEPKAQAPKPAKPEGTPQPAYMAEDQPLQLKEYDDPKPAEPEPWWKQLFGFLIKLVIVIGLVLGSLFVMKKVSGGKLNLSLPNTRGRNIVVLESTHLSPQQAIHLISLGGERLLVVGAGPQGLTTLTEITDPREMRPFLQAQKATTASAFNQVFDLESVVQDDGGDILKDALREQFGRNKRGGWPNS